MVRVSIREHAEILREKLVRLRTATFRALCADCQTILEIVARFLALLELYREGLVAFDQVTALGELTVQWTGDATLTELSVDEYTGAPEAAESEPAAGIGERELVQYLEGADPAAEEETQQ
jgi:segregation and condensation protein A